MRARLAVVLLLLATPLTALAQSPHLLTLDAPTHKWEGTPRELGVWPPLGFCPPASCDLVALHVELPEDLPPPWPALVASADWPAPDDDFDLALYDAWGYRVVVTTATTSTSETIRVPEIKPGSYTLAVAPRLVTESGYDGLVALAPTS